MVPLILTAARTLRNFRESTRIGTVGGGVGHNLPQEAPAAFAKAIVDVSAM